MDGDVRVETKAESAPSSKRQLPPAVDSRRGLRFEDLSVGQSASFAKTITEADLVLFAGVSGDTNPVHFDEDFAAQSMFKGRIAHGMLTASFVSTVLGTRLPGPGCIYVSQDMRFIGPVRIGDTVTARVTVEELVPAKRRAVMKTACLVDGRPVVDGTAVIWLPEDA